MAAYDLTLESRFYAAGESKSTDIFPLCQGDSWVSGSVGNSTGQGTRWRTAPVMPRDRDHGAGGSEGRNSPPVPCVAEK